MTLKGFSRAAAGTRHLARAQLPLTTTVAETRSVARPAALDVDTPQRLARLFPLALLAFSGLAVVARVGFVVGWTAGTRVVGDSLFYQQTAARFADGAGYTWSLPGSTKQAATALHPPVFSLVLALLDLLGIRSPDGHRIALAFICAAGVFLTGLIGRRLGGPGVGLVAAAIAALHPLWIQPSGLLMSESIYLVIVPVLLLLGLRCVDRPSPWSFALLGLSIGIATLTRAEAVGFLIVLGLPLVAFAARAWRARLALALSLLAGTSLLVAPWLIRSETELGGLTLSSDQGSALAGSYCTDTFASDQPNYASFSARCAYGAAGIILLSRPPRPATTWTERTVDDALTRGGTRFVRSHVADLPEEVLARDGKLWGLFAPNAQLRFDVAEGRIYGFEQAGAVANWVLLALGAVGAVQLARRSRLRFAVVAAPVLLVTLTAALFYASTRMRVAAEPAVSVLASVGIVSLYRLSVVTGRLRGWSPRLRSRDAIGARSSSG